MTMNFQAFPHAQPIEAAPLARRGSVPVAVGSVLVGGGAPVVVQSMTNTDTADVDANVAQVGGLGRGGFGIVRITVGREEGEAAVPEIRERLEIGKGLCRARGENPVGAGTL